MKTGGKAHAASLKMTTVEGSGEKPHLEPLAQVSLKAAQHVRTEYTGTPGLHGEPHTVTLRCQPCSVLGRPWDLGNTPPL